MGSGPQEASSAAVRIALNTEKAMRLRATGASYREIARELDISVGAAYGYVTSALLEVRESARETAAQMIQLEVERLDALYLKLSGKLSRQTATLPSGAILPDPDEGTVRAMLDVMKARREILGLDAPKRTELSGPDGGAIPIATTVFDAREVLARRLADMASRAGAVVVPIEALEVAATPSLVSPLLTDKPSAEPHDGVPST